MNPYTHGSQGFQNSYSARKYCCLRTAQYLSGLVLLLPVGTGPVCSNGARRLRAQGCVAWLLLLRLLLLLLHGGQAAAARRHARWRAPRGGGDRRLAPLVLRRSEAPLLRRRRHHLCAQQHSMTVSAHSHRWQTVKATDCWEHSFHPNKHIGTFNAAAGFTPAARRPCPAGAAAAADGSVPWQLPEQGPGLAA